jgi:branched-chain amino acid transport system ATP-binding protein
MSTSLPESPDPSGSQSFRREGSAPATGSQPSSSQPSSSQPSSSQPSSSQPSSTDSRTAHVAAAEGALLRAEELVAGYVPGVNILNGCDLYVHEGELVGIIGPNGAGKSTLLKALFGLVKIRTGTVTLAGEDITGFKANRLVAKGVGFVPQSNNVFPSLTIEENLQMGLYQAPKRFSERFDFVVSLFPALADRRRQRAGSLSGGERQMVAMGRALMMEPSVLLLDEPSAGLSPVMQDEVFLRTRQINRAGVSVVMVEQNARRCLQICDRGYVLDQGRNAYTASGRDLINDPKVIELYLGTLARA